MLKNIVIFEAHLEWVSTVEEFLLQEWLEAAYSDEDIVNLQETEYAPCVVARKICDPDNDAKAWLALCDGTPAGMISSKDVSGGIIVSNDFRGQGIGSALIEARNNHLKAQGAAHAFAHVEATNTASIAMHMNKLGYKFTAATQELVSLHEKSGDALKDLKDTQGNPAVLELVITL